jgi:hypothetical protein
VPVDPQASSAALLAMTQAIGAFTTFLPPLAEVRKKTLDDPLFAGDVRLGEVAAVGLTIGVGAIVSGLVGSNAPMLVSVVTAVGLVFLYESTLRSNPSQGVLNDAVS